jgi:anti-sigma factor RsiW
MAAHLEQCADCAARIAELRRISGSLAAVGRLPASRELRARVRGDLVKAAAAHDGATERPVETRVTEPASPPRGRLAWRPQFRTWSRNLSGLAAACALSILATWWVIGGQETQQQLEHDVLSAHIRSLLQASPIEVASSDMHTVKPWFAGRIELSPDVKDLSAQGFRLIGGRLDYIANRRVAVIVYGRRLHTVSVFVMPANRGDASPAVFSRQGYNLAHWVHAGLGYWAVSDLSAGELAQLGGLL